MREKYLWLVIFVLTALTLGQACYIYQSQAIAAENPGRSPLRPDLERGQNAEKAYESQWKGFEKWRDAVKGQMGRGDPLQERDFDVFFNDQFFTGKLSPFVEMERIRREMAGEFGGSDQQLFDGYWDAWFQQRMRMAEFKTDISRTDKDVTITITIPGLLEDTLDINMTAERIKIAFGTRTFSNEKAVPGLIKKRSYTGYVKIMQVPAGIEPGSGKVSVDGEQVKIRYDLK